MAYIPGSGFRKPLNMLEAPIYPSISKALPTFKSSGKHWTVDVGQTLISTEADTQIYDGAILAKSYRDNIDGYGQSSHQEKITVFRPPLRSYYEDIGPLNRLPATVNAIVPRINPGTTSDGTSAYQVNNQTKQDVSKYISDRISTDSWQQTFFMPLDMPLDNSILPNLTTTLPNRSVSAGYQAAISVDAPRDIYFDNRALDEYKLHAYASSGYHTDYTSPMYEQAENQADMRLYESLPRYSAHSGYTTENTMNGYNNAENMHLDKTLPVYSSSAGYYSQYNIDGDLGGENVHLDKTLPVYSTTSGYTTDYTMNGETKLGELQLDQRLESKLQVLNPSSENGYKSRVEYYTPIDHLKLKENPQVPVVAHSSFQYGDNDNIKSRTPQFRQKKIQPTKQYGNGLNSGTIKTYGVEEQKLSNKFFRNRK